MGVELCLDRVQDCHRRSISSKERGSVHGIQGIIRILHNGLGKVTPMEIQQD